MIHFFGLTILSNKEIEERVRLWMKLGHNLGYQQGREYEREVYSLYGHMIMPDIRAPKELLKEMGIKERTL